MRSHSAEAPAPSPGTSSSDAASGCPVVRLICSGNVTVRSGGDLDVDRGSLSVGGQPRRGSRSGVSLGEVRMPVGGEVRFDDGSDVSPDGGSPTTGSLTVLDNGNVRLCGGPVSVGVVG